MNKYQKALDDISLEVSEEFVNNINPQALCLMQELVNKETPMKPILKYNSVENKVSHCPKCETYIGCGILLDTSFKYCPICGQRLDWGDDK